jgi:hypothetical protein
MPRWIDIILILCGAVLGAVLAHVKTVAEVNVVGTAWSLTLIPGLFFIAPLGGVHGFLAEVIWPVIIGCNALAYALIVYLLVTLVRRLLRA